MADAIVSAVADQLISAATEKIHHGVHLVRGVEEELLGLSDKLKNVRYVLDDAENKQFKDERVKDWLRRLEQTSYEMEDVLEEWNYAIIQHEKMESGSGSAPPPKHKVCSFIPSSCFCFKRLAVRHDIGQKIERLKSKLDGVLKEKDEFNFLQSQPVNDPSPASWRVPATSWIDSAEVQGRNDDKDILVNKLAANVGSGYQVLSIVGAGGLGKTTLAQLVYNDSRVKECFDLRIWICVSDPFDVVAIAKGIIESIKPQSSPHTNELDVCIKVLTDSISCKRFLLVLDDVWTEEHQKWESLKIALQCGGTGSKILVTTRKKKVARIMGTVDKDIHPLGLLSDEDCRFLLMRTALTGRSQNDFELFHEIGKEMAKKCRGLPLAAKTLGSVLLFKNTVQEWDNVLKSEIWELEGAGVELFPHLLLSYRELSPNLKRCFSSCAFFPKDTRLEVEKLIRIWMSLGYLGSNNASAGEVVELKGREIFEDLAMRSLFQDFEKDKSTEQISACKIHDIVHDFARFLTKRDGAEATRMIKRTCQDCDSLLGPHVQEYPRLYWDKECPAHFCNCLTSLRVLQFKWKWPPNIHCPLGMEKLIHLRFMNIGCTRLTKEDLEIICKLYFLQTLLLQDCSIKEIPIEIGNLVHLRNIDLSSNKEIEELPDSIWSLLELQSLSLSECSLKKIPREIGNLFRLKSLDLRYNEELKELPDGVCNLLELQCLSLGNCSLKKIPREIGNLFHLKSLDLSYNKELKELPESMGRLLGLQTLSLCHCSFEEIPEEIMNWVKLRRLDLSMNEGLKKLPEKICSFLELQSLDLYGCWNLCSLPEGLAQLPSISSQTAFLGGSGCNGSIGLLKKLNTFHGSLHLIVQLSGGIDVEELVRDLREAELRNKIHLQTLRIDFRMIDNYDGDGEECLSSSSLSLPSSLWVDVIEALEPHHNLQFLTIRDYKGLRLPNWISSSLNRVRKIELVDCDVSSLPVLGKLPFLEKLSMYRLKKLKVLGVEWLGIRGEVMDVESSSLVAFPKLKRLMIEVCDEWCEWEDISADEEVSAVVSLMPCLSGLHIWSCNGLKMLPHRLLRKASSSLEWLDVRCSSELIKCYGDKDGSPWKSISQHNPQLQLIIIDL